MIVCAEIHNICLVIYSSEHIYDKNIENKRAVHRYEGREIGAIRGYDVSQCFLDSTGRLIGTGLLTYSCGKFLDFLKGYGRGQQQKPTTELYNKDTNNRTEDKSDEFTSRGKQHLIFVFKGNTRYRAPLDL